MQDTDADSLWTRLRRRKVVQWGIAYAAGSWGLLQGLAYATRTTTRSGRSAIRSSVSRTTVIALGEWSAERHAALVAELEQHVVESWKEAVQYGTLTDGPRLSRDLMFQDVFKEMPVHLRKQREQLRAEQGG